MQWSSGEIQWLVWLCNDINYCVIKQTSSYASDSQRGNGSEIEYVYTKDAKKYYVIPGFSSQLIESGGFMKKFYSCMGNTDRFNWHNLCEYDWYNIAQPTRTFDIKLLRDRSGELTGRGKNALRSEHSWLMLCLFFQEDPLQAEINLLSFSFADLRWVCVLFGTHFYDDRVCLYNLIRSNYYNFLWVIVTIIVYLFNWLCFQCISSI